MMQKILCQYQEWRGRERVNEEELYAPSQTQKQDNILE